MIHRPRLKFEASHPEGETPGLTGPRVEHDTGNLGYALRQQKIGNRLKWYATFKDTRLGHIGTKSQAKWACEAHRAACDPQPVFTLASQMNMADRLACIYRGWIAVDLESGAFIRRSNGRTEDGMTKYILILPNQSPTERGGHFREYHWYFPQGRFIYRCSNDAQAIEKGTGHLARMLRVRVIAQAIKELREAQITITQEPHDEKTNEE